MVNIAGERRLTSIKQLVSDMMFNANLTGTITIDEITNTVTVQLVEPVTIDGTIAISSIPNLIISSMPAITIADIVNLNIDSMPPIAVTGIGGTVTVGGSMAITSIGGTVTVGGTLAISSIGGTVTVGGTVAVSSIGGTVTIGGTVAVSSIGGTVQTNETLNTLTLTSSVVSVPSADTLVLAANANRKFLLIQRGTTVGRVFVKFSAGAATVTNGMLFRENAYFSFFQDEIYTGEIRAISVGSSKVLYVTEGV